MGQTLTNGIFLPNEGERNCYEGLAGNWRALDYLIGGYNVHVDDLVIHVSQADRDKWDAVDNKADASALTAHTGDTTIHVTAADKAKWDAVTGKADDADAVHKSGAETIAGPKTFSDTVTVTSINGIVPSLLPAPDFDAGVDISGYLTNLNKGLNTFTPNVNGWIEIELGKTTLSKICARCRQTDGLIYASETSEFSIWGISFPVFASKGISIYLYANSLNKAKFYPCRGNT